MPVNYSEIEDKSTRENNQDIWKLCIQKQDMKTTQLITELRDSNELTIFLDTRTYL